MSSQAPLIVSCTHRTLHICTLSGTPHSSRSPPSALHWFPSGHLLAEATPSSNLLLHPDSFATAAAEITLTAAKKPSPILAISISQASRFLAYGCTDGQVSVVDLVSKQPIASFSLGAPIVAIAFQRTSDSRYLAVATAHAVSLFSRVSNRLVAKYAVATPERSSSFGGGREPKARLSPTATVKITTAAFSPQHLNLLVAADESGCINVWDISKNVAPRARTENQLHNAVEGGTTYSRFTSTMRTPVSDMSFAPAGSAASLCVGGFDKQLRFFDPALKRFLFSIACPAPVAAVSFATDAEHLAVGLTNGTMVVWKVNAKEGNGKVLTEVCVDRALEDRESDRHEISAVKSVQFQPMDIYNAVSSKGSRHGDGASNVRLRPPPLTELVRNSTSGRSEMNEADRLHLLGEDIDPLTDRYDYEEEELDLDVVGLDVVADAGIEGVSGKLRSNAPRDSDIFSPVARRMSRKQGSISGNVPAKASSFHETPRSERRAHITFRTPRSRTAHTMTPAKATVSSSLLSLDEDRESSNTGRYLGGRKEVPRRVGRWRQNGEVEPDTNSQESITSKSATKETLVHSSHGDVTQLQVSAISEEVWDDSKEGSLGQGLDRALVPTNSALRAELSSLPNKSQSLEQNHVHLQSSIPRSSSDGGLLRQKLTRSSLGEVRPERDTGVASTPPQNMQRHARENVLQVGSSAGTESAGGYPSRRLSGGLISPYQPTSYADGQIARGEVTSREKVQGVEGLAEELRLVVAQELDLLRFELRRDMLDIHSEMVVMSAKQSQELKAAFVGRDRRVRQLEQEVIRLQQENERLKRKYGLGL